jgi:deoxycytidylate deaminase
MKSQYKCLLCGTLHESPQEAESCCEHYVEVFPCSNCKDYHYSESQVESCE